jgi:chemotaxis protein CheC
MGSMMVVTDQQSDALAELINIAFSRAAASLSELTGHRVSLNVPQVAVHPIDELFDELCKFVPGELATIHQVFTGPVAGDALLMLNYEGAVVLSDLLTNEPGRSNRLDASAREVLTEIGNILLNACLGVFGNILEVKVSFSVPRLHLETLDTLLKWLITGKEELQYALVVATAFRLRDSAVQGYLVIVLGVVSLDRLIHEVEKWEERQGGSL